MDREDINPTTSQLETLNILCPLLCKEIKYGSRLHRTKAFETVRGIGLNSEYRTSSP